MEKKFKFQVHYNVPESKKKNKPQAGVWYMGKYHLTQNVEINVPTKSVHSPGNRPNWLIEGEIEQTRFKIYTDKIVIG